LVRRLRRFRACSRTGLPGRDTLKCARDAATSGPGHTSKVHDGCRDSAAAPVRGD
jgi:hypothetical protein